MACLKMVPQEKPFCAGRLSATRFQDVQRHDRSEAADSVRAPAFPSATHRPCAPVVSTCNGCRFSTAR